MALLRCTACGRYTMKPQCPACGAKAIPPEPAKYSPEDTYGKYRRRLKREAQARGRPAGGAAAPDAAQPPGGVP